jgi:CxxC-x17-CxxC domain-containing protein
MIDGVTSRPFSAKTLPPMVKSGDKKIEDAVINSSRALYCKPREVVEREINDWSGMSLGNFSESSSAGMEKFPVICSLCKLEKTVPFKPEPGRAVYCKECIAKIKSGEVKVEKKGQDQINYDESKFFKPLADLGIEFEQKGKKVEENNRYPERVEKPTPKPVFTPKPQVPAFKQVSSAPKPSFLAGKPGIIGTIKKVFVPAPKVVLTKAEIPKKVDNSALREVLNKTLQGQQANPVISTPIPIPVKIPTPEPISLDSLKDKIKEEEKKLARPSGGNFIPHNDRSAGADEMNKLKNLISTTSAGQAEKTPTPTPNSAPIPTPTPIPMPIPQKPMTKEVPEDVLRKILE